MPVCINYEAVNELDIQSRVNMKGVSTRNYKANNEGEIKFVTCLFCGKFHFRNSCAFRYAKCFKCGKIGHVQSVYKAAVHFTSSGTESCHLDPSNSAVPNDHLSLSAVLKTNVPRQTSNSRML
ncbi:unnamed protein product [Schistosoma curassoni]|uniref:CCHC-type domain-containing protein n=1 Tax=Schistosoma curassoni TaxID=6186 RepID=A0A183KUZ5_9TREM|nr:unnamed protein product [Schistosoma curassoni]